ncbi:MAG: hypothetical protein HUU16_10900, partial [Candidatus Omnitrophica bacterium]|nr:hypothetical protein [Candidatus Omnitrophota bacterium]
MRALRLHSIFFTLAVLLVGARALPAQTYLPSLSGPLDLTVMPDLQQPDTLIVQGGGVPPAPSWPNYCSPVSAANIWKFYDTRDGINLAPWVGDLPQPGPPYGWMMSWSTATIQGQGTPAAPLPPLPPPVYMDTNGVSTAGPSPWAGTRIQDIYQGMKAYTPAVESANGLTKGPYTASITMDELAIWEPVNPPTVNQVNEAAQYANYIASINSDIPAVVSFDRWVVPGTGLAVGNIEYYVFGISTNGDSGGGVIEQWDGSDTGHSVTGIGYHQNFDPDGMFGLLPLADWYITRDNWLSTGVDVAVPVSGHWMATVYAATPELNIIKWSQPPVQNPMSPEPNCYWGWNEKSIYGGDQLAADDWLCSDTRPITDIHWWGSYLNWQGEIPPATASSQFHIGIWTDIPAGASEPYSHPGVMVWQWIVARAELNERMVGCDAFIGMATETCFRYDYLIPPDQWFYQDPFPATRVYWISIGMIPDPTPAEQFPWGWKTREHFFNDDAVRIFIPTAPVPGSAYQMGEPIIMLLESWDLAFELTSDTTVLQPTPTPTVTLTETPTATDTAILEPTPTATDTLPSVPSSTPTSTQTLLSTPTSTSTRTSTTGPTPTVTETLPPTPTPTDTLPSVNTPTPTDTLPSVNTPTPTDTLPSVNTPTPTDTLPSVNTPTPTDTLPSVNTPTPTDTLPSVNTPTPTDTLPSVVTPTPT